jgi:hypothetical protein
MSLSARVAELEERNRRCNADIARFIAVRDLENLCTKDCCVQRRYGPQWIFSMKTLTDLVAESDI